MCGERVVYHRVEQDGWIRQDLIHLDNSNHRGSCARPELTAILRDNTRFSCRTQGRRASRRFSPRVAFRGVLSKLAVPAVLFGLTPSPRRGSRYPASQLVSSRAGRSGQRNAGAAGVLSLVINEYSVVERQAARRVEGREIPIGRRSNRRRWPGCCVDICKRLCLSQTDHFGLSPQTSQVSGFTRSVPQPTSVRQFLLCRPHLDGARALNCLPHSDKSPVYPEVTWCFMGSEAPQLEVRPYKA